MKFWLFISALLSPALFVAGQNTIVVVAGDFDRRDTVVEFDLPANVKPAALLTDENGNSSPLQVEGKRGAFVVHNLKRGQRQTYKFSDGAAEEVVHADVTKENITLRLSNKPAFVYHTAKTDFPAERKDLKPIFHRAAYIHPVFSPSGALVTDDYPVNHKHHHGIWMSWTHTDFEGRAPDFWNMGDGKGTVEFAALQRSWSGPVHAGFIARHNYIDLTAPSPKTALNETWKVRLYAVGQQQPATTSYYLFDIDITDTCATESPMKLPLYRYGGICVRGNWAWNGRTNALVLTSEGETDRAKGDKGQVQARWVHMGGLVNGALTGIAGFGHPMNFRSPEPVRLNAAEPYFNFTPQQSGDMEITPDKPFVGRYRFLVADGKADKAELERIWNDYAQPPSVMIGK